ncbi:hypothetical protein QG37_00948 [Candidozyma auris]|uniref:Uncharacterized protein n=1 Tax=Candidozyma auris TaxID=498019 RepID=A0A0L0P6T1_CANAR|nr:hypothetical protein QG37_00948 [[Candida] auris]
MLFTSIKMSSKLNGQDSREAAFHGLFKAVAFSKGVQLPEL